jgi:Rps23 Pro-64 3,4-dihydroxylase Tpa1-like proline 4-hydroxylase
MNLDIEVIDNFLNNDDFQNVSNYCKNASYNYGEVDDYSAIPSGENILKYVTGMTHQIFPSNNLNNKILNLIDSKCRFQFSVLKNLDLQRMYVNCFAPGENPRFHIDTPENVSQLYTCLYYINENWNLDDGGETQFYLNRTIYGVPPIPNRMVLFDGSILHKATSFKNYHRFSIALKYCKNE